MGFLEKTIVIDILEVENNYYRLHFEKQPFFQWKELLSARFVIKNCLSITITVDEDNCSVLENIICTVPEPAEIYYFWFF